MIKSTIQKKITLPLALSISLSLAPLFLVNNAYSQEELKQAKAYYKQPVHVLHVTGSGQVQVDTPIANVNLMIEAKANTAEQTQKQIAQKSQAVVNYLKLKQVKKLKTSSIQLSARYEYENNQQKFLGYQASYGLIFQADQNTVGTYLDELVKLGARVDSIDFSAEPQAIEQAKLKALELATLDATTKAKTVFGSLNLTMGKVIKIHIQDSQYNPVQHRSMPMLAMAMKADAATTTVVGGEQNINANVVLEVNY